jgi:prepilin-type N-terminal cleavage/methylation domain-containing protein
MKLFRKNSRAARAGFSLTEVSVGMGVVGIVFISLYSGLTSGVATVGMTRENSRATQIMVEKLDSIRLYSWDKITKLGFSETPFTASFMPSGTATSGSAGCVYSGTVTVSPAPVAEGYKDNMRQITVSLSWQTGSLKRQRSMTTMVAKDGMQNYVY